MFKSSTVSSASTTASYLITNEDTFAKSTGTSMASAISANCWSACSATTMVNPYTISYTESISPDEREKLLSQIDALIAMKETEEKGITQVLKK